MPITKPTSVSDLSLDLYNFRTIPQADEVSAIKAMSTIDPDHFWALMESLLDSGYLPTENILVLKVDTHPKKLIVREGNRRIAALKLILNLLPEHDIEMSSAMRQQIASLSNEWRVSNAQVPCAIYDSSESITVERIVALAHGKGEQASRSQWNAVARARHNREANHDSQPDLDLLEKFLKNAKNITDDQKERWTGVFPLTVLEEAMKRLAPRLGQANAPELAKHYPSIGYRQQFDDLLRDIGLGRVKFDTIRNRGEDFGERYGIPLSTNSAKANHSSKEQAASSQGKSTESDSTSSNVEGSTSDEGSTSSDNVGAKKRTLATATSDPISVKRKLRGFKPRGSQREKVVDILNEMKNLNLDKNPLAFCFLLRSMFEISAKAYCNEHVASNGPKIQKGGQDRRLLDVLRDIVAHLTNENKDMAKTKKLHGAMTELANPNGILSVTSLNQLVHNPDFVVSTPNICMLFGNVFPLIEEMN